MSLRKVFGTNKTKEQDGTWIKGPEGMEYLIARMGNKNYRDLIDKLLAPHRVALRQGRMDDELLTKITREVISKTILLDWKNVEIEEGQGFVDYTPAIGAKEMEANPDFADFISMQSQTFANYAADQEAEDLKNSSSVSPGN